MSTAVVEPKATIQPKPKPKRTQKTAFDACLKPLLKALHWHGKARHLREATPHLMSIVSISMFCNVLRHLEYEYSASNINLAEIDSRLFPCLYISKSQEVMVLLGRKGTCLQVYDGERQSEITLDLDEIADKDTKGTAYLFKHTLDQGAREYAREHWISSLVDNNKSLLYSALFLSFFLNILALATPIFVMSVYDRVISTGSFSMLFQFVLGILLALGGSFVLYRLRAKFLAIMGARMDAVVGNNIFERLLFLPPNFTESATVGSQVARIRDFDRLREFLSSSMVAVFFDAPFIVISLAVIAILGGVLVFVPMTMIAAFALMTFIVRFVLRKKQRISAKDHAQQQEFLLESINQLAEIKQVNLIDKWKQRYRDLSANAALSNFQIGVIGAINNAISDAIMYLSALAVIGFGAIMVMNTSLSVGAMIAIMIIIWRVLTPLKSLFNTLPRLLQMYSSFRQIDRLLQIPTEKEAPKSLDVDQQHIRGSITFDRVSFRYYDALMPALSSVHFSCKPGELIGIVGRSGAGKSTLLKLILGLYYPQGGGVRVDNYDVRQISPGQLRNAIAYLPQKNELFYGSIATNLRLANPTATDQELHDVCDKVGILQEITHLPKGFDTPIKDHSMTQLASSFRQSLCLARAYLKNAKLVLLDEPSDNLDFAADERMMQSVQAFRGRATVLLVTHRPSHLKKMDRIILMEQGQMLVQGPPDEVLPKIPKEML